MAGSGSWHAAPPARSQDREQEDHGPPQGADALSAWIRTPLTREREFSNAERTAVTELGPAATPELLAILTDEALSLQDGPGEGRAPGRTAQLLSDLQAVEAVAPMIQVLGACDALDVLYSTLIDALQGMGEVGGRSPEC